jgi:hypothetical protein
VNTAPGVRFWQIDLFVIGHFCKYLIEYNEYLTCRITQGSLGLFSVQNSTVAVAIAVGFAKNAASVNAA